jgi:hypothetical protein
MGFIFFFPIFSFPPALPTWLSLNDMRYNKNKDFSSFRSWEEKHHQDVFRFRRASFYSQFKSKVDIDDSPMTSDRTLDTHTHNSHIDWSVCLLGLKHLVSLQARVRSSVQTELDLYTTDRLQNFYSLIHFPLRRYPIPRKNIVCVRISLPSSSPLVSHYTDTPFVCSP